MQKADFDWWMQRLRHNLQLFDLVRIDHFRGLVAYWQVPATYETARQGKWVQVPTEEFFSTLLRQFPSAAIIAEDLGYITQDVRDVIAKYGFPCMRVLQFAFDGDPSDNPHCPHNHRDLSKTFENLSNQDLTSTNCMIRSN